MRFHLRDRCGSTERPLITHEEKTHAHDTLPAFLGSRLLVRDHDGIYMGGLCYEPARWFPSPRRPLFSCQKQKDTTYPKTPVRIKYTDIFTNTHGYVYCMLSSRMDLAFFSLIMKQPWTGLMIHVWKRIRIFRTTTTNYWRCQQQ